MLPAAYFQTCVSDIFCRGNGQDKIAERLEALPNSSAVTDFRCQAEPDERQSRGSFVLTGLEESPNCGTGPLERFHWVVSELFGILCGRPKSTRPGELS